MADPKDEKKDEQKANTAKDTMLAKAIAGLKFRSNKGIPEMDKTTGKPVMEGGKPKLRYVPDLRPMTTDDVLSTAMDGSVLVIVAKDGSKHRVAL